MDRAKRRLTRPTLECIEERYLPSAVGAIPRITYLAPKPHVSAVHPIAARLIANHDKVAGAVIYFSGPMDPTSTADPRRFVLVDDHKADAKDWLARFTFRSNSQGTLYFKTARYDPSDNSLTLTLGKPVSNLGRYRLGATWNDVRPKVRVPTDPQGGVLARFSVRLNGNGAKMKVGR